ncbi:MAG: aminotransferase class V-fold PLP-dependent enzyme [Oscillospiraceae bacterium]|nr:aminotransferase class V-fold PLP-dependent enzyme [Oscillospiraceae bacterium]
MIYFDNAATSFQKPAAVRREVLRAMEGMTSPARGDHVLARRAAETVYRCREEAADLFSVKEAERVIFTFNATHALNIAIRSLVKDGGNVVISGYEHNAVTRCLASFENLRVTVAEAPLFDTDAVAEAFYRCVRLDTDAVICNHVSNVFGFVQPMDTIAEICREKGVPLIVDASQSAGSLQVDMEKWQAAFIAMPGHKGLLGPQGTGLLLCGASANPILFGGTGSDSLTQEMPAYLPDRLEAGTHNVAGIAGLLAGLQYVKRLGFTEIEKRKKKLTKQFCESLAREPRLQIFAANEDSAQCGVVSLVFRDLDSEAAAAELARRGICVRAGYHCSPLAHKTAGTLDGGTVRFSFSVFNTLEEIRRGAEEVRYILRRKC